MPLRTPSRWSTSCRRRVRRCCGAYGVDVVFAAGLDVGFEVLAGEGRVSVLFPACACLAASLTAFWWRLGYRGWGFSEGTSAGTCVVSEVRPGAEWSCPEPAVSDGVAGVCVRGFWSVAESRRAGWGLSGGGDGECEGCGGEPRCAVWREPPMPVTSRSRSGSASMTSKTFSPKALTIFLA